MSEVDKSGQAPLSNSLPHDAFPSNSFGQTNSLPAPQSNNTPSGQEQFGAPGATPCCHFTTTLWRCTCISECHDTLHMILEADKNLETPCFPCNVCLCSDQHGKSQGRCSSILQGARGHRWRP